MQNTKKNAPLIKSKNFNLMPYIKQFLMKITKHNTRFRLTDNFC